MTIKHFPEQQTHTQSVSTPSTMAEEEPRPPTPSSAVNPNDIVSPHPSPSPQSPEKVPFREATVAFAVDISGSTQGPTIRAERNFITRISSHLSPDAQAKARILPWDNVASPLLPLESVSSLQSRGGTDPRVLLYSPPHRGAVVNSSLWFLMTDGLISPQVRISFAAQLARARVHGTSCITVIFGDPASAFGEYGGCDISVGVGVYAVVPNCAFLFCNTRNGQVRLLQSKGVFTDALLKGREAPVFEQGKIKWETLPLVDLSDFTDVVLPKGGPLLGEQEIVLQDAMVVNLEDLYSNKLGADQVSKILANEDNVASIVMTAQTRGHAHVQQFQGWIQQQQMPAPAPAPACAPAHAVASLTPHAMTLNPSKSALDQPADLQETQRRVQMQQMQQLQAQQRQRLIDQAMARSATTVSSAAALNSTGWYNSSSSSSNHNSNGNGITPGPEGMGRAPTQGSSLRASAELQPGSELGAPTGLGRVAGPGPLPQVGQNRATSATLHPELSKVPGSNGMRASRVATAAEATTGQRENRAGSNEKDPSSASKLGSVGVLRTPPSAPHKVEPYRRRFPWHSSYKEAQ